MGKLKLAIIGSRSFTNYDLLEKSLEPYKSKISLVISGAAKGADSLGERWALKNNIKTLIFLPDWEQYGKKAGIIRNKDIINNCDCAIAFWDGISKGTQHALSLCEQLNKPYKIINYINEK